jgi:gamma-glutamyl-gamma-aminobutyrate hydrolase PuuD
VQWHPEMASNDVAQQGLFQGLVAAAIKIIR